MKLPVASRFVACIGTYSFASALYTWFTKGAVAWFEILFGAICAAVFVYSVRHRRSQTSGDEMTPAAWLAATYVLAAGATFGLNIIRWGSAHAFNAAGITQA